METSNKLFIVMYHYTRDLVHSRYPKIKGLDLPLFRQQLEFFKQNFNVVTMEQVLQALAALPTPSSDNATDIRPPPPTSAKAR